MLQVEHLYYTYDDGTCGVEDVSLDTSKGDIIGIIGENGAGKSTLFKSILGLLKPQKGRVLYDGVPLSYGKKSMRQYHQKVNMVFQDPDRQIFFSRVYDDVAFALRNLGLSQDLIDRRVTDALEKTGILPLKDKPVHFLSYGQKKRVAISGVLAMNCELLLLDEPTAGLDPRMTQGMAALLEDLKKEGKKLILSSHDMNFIYRVCDYIYLMDAGKVVAEGSPDTVFLDEDLLTGIGLEMPSLVALHKKGDLPLFSRPSGLYDYLRRIQKNPPEKKTPLS